MQKLGIRLSWTSLFADMLASHCIHAEAAAMAPCTGESMTLVLESLKFLQQVRLVPSTFWKVWSRLGIKPGALRA